MLGVSRLSTLALSCSLLGLVGCGSGSALSNAPALPNAETSTSGSVGPFAATTGSATQGVDRRVTASAAKPAAAQPPLFYDDFSDGKAAAWRQTAGTWSVCHPSAGAPYAYCATGVPNDNAFAGSTSWTDYSLTVAVQPVMTTSTGKSKQALDIIVRAKDQNHFDELELAQGGDGSQHWEMWRDTAHGYDFLGRGSASFTSGTTYWLRLNATGAQFTASMSTDGQNFTTLGSVTDSAYANGGIGLRAWGGMKASFGPVLVASAGTAAPPTPAPSSPPSGPLVSEIPSQADAFVNSVGVDTHFVYSNEAYTTQFPAVSQLLINSGIKHIRDSGPTYDQTYLSEMAMFSSHGVHHSLGMPINSTPAQVTSALNAFGTANIDFVEPMNEYDSYAKQDPNWLANIIAEQKMIWNTVRANPAFNGVTVLGPALASHKSYALLGDLDAYEDAGNLHAGFCNYNPGTNNGTVNFSKVTALIRTSTVSKPIWTTETGYDDNSNLTHVCDTPDPAVAKYDPRLLAERWNAGEPRSYMFQFVDKPTVGNPFAYMGLVTINGTPKPQYTALQSMLGLLSDPGSAFTPTTLNYALGGQTQSVHHTLLQKRDGTYVMMLWIEKPCLVSIYDPTQVAVPSQQVSLSVPSMTTASDYTYDTAKWTVSPQNLAINAGTVNLTVTDAISFVEFH